MVETTRTVTVTTHGSNEGTPDQNASFETEKQRKERECQEVLAAASEASIQRTAQEALRNRDEAPSALTSSVSVVTITPSVTLSEEETRTSSEETFRTLFQNAVANSTLKQARESDPELNRLFNKMCRRILEGELPKPNPTIEQSLQDSEVISELRLRIDEGIKSAETELNTLLNSTEFDADKIAGLKESLVELQESKVRLEREPKNLSTAVRQLQDRLHDLRTKSDAESSKAPTVGLRLDFTLRKLNILPIMRYLTRTLLDLSNEAENSLLLFLRTPETHIEGIGELKRLEENKKVWLSIGGHIQDCDVPKGEKNPFSELAPFVEARMSAAIRQLEAAKGHSKRMHADIRSLAELLDTQNRLALQIANLEADIENQRQVFMPEYEAIQKNIAERDKEEEAVLRAVLSHLVERQTRETTISSVKSELQTLNDEREARCREIEEFCVRFSTHLHFLKLNLVDAHLHLTLSLDSAIQELTESFASIRKCVREIRVQIRSKVEDSLESIEEAKTQMRQLSEKAQDATSDLEARMEHLNSEPIHPRSTITKIETLRSIDDAIKAVSTTSVVNLFGIPKEKFDAAASTHAQQQKEQTLANLNIRKSMILSDWQKLEHEIKKFSVEIIRQQSLVDTGVWRYETWTTWKHSLKQMVFSSVGYAGSVVTAPFRFVARWLNKGEGALPPSVTQQIQPHGLTESSISIAAPMGEEGVSDT